MNVRKKNLLIMDYNTIFIKQDELVDVLYNSQQTFVPITALFLFEVYQHMSGKQVQMHPYIYPCTLIGISEKIKIYCHC